MNTYVNDSTLNADNNINVINNTSFNRTSATATNDITIAGSKSEVISSTLNAGNNINIQNKVKVDKSTLNADNDINLTNYSNIYSSTLNAGNDINLNHVLFKNSTASANENIVVENYADVFNSSLNAGNDISIDTVNLHNDTTPAKATVIAENDVNINNADITKANIHAKNINLRSNTSMNTFVTDSTLSTSENINVINNTTLTRTNTSAGNNINVTSDSTIDTSELTAGNNIIISDSTIKNADLIANNEIDIADSFAGGKIEATTTTGDINIYNTIGIPNTENTIYATAILNAGNDVNIINSVIGDTTIESSNNTNIIDSYLGNTAATAGGNIASVDSSLESGLFDAVGNINLAGIYVANDLTITGANDVVISNSNTAATEGYPTIVGLSTGLKPISDYNRTKFTDSTFATAADDLGYGAPAYAEGTRISYIGGSLDISNANSVAIVNTGVKGNLTQNNIATDTSLIYSYLGGSYMLDGLIGGESSVFKTFIRGSYERIYPDVSSNIDDITKLRYGSQLDTDFRQQFTPKGFAASDDEINIMKRKTISNIVKGKNNSIKLNSAFKAY